MTTKTINQESPENENRLLSSEERAILSQIPSKEAPHSWRAQALLAIDEGATQAEAGRQAGLTKGQLRYWLGKFRKERTSIFPEELLNQAQQEDEEEAPQELLAAEETAGPAVGAAVQKEDTLKAKKKGKQKSKKKSKKARKSEKDKKKKKGKKSKKKSKKKRSKKQKGEKGKSSKKKSKK